MKTKTQNSIRALDLLSETEVGEILGVKRDTLRHWRQGKKGPPYFQPWCKAYVRYPRQALAEWIDEHITVYGKPAKRAKKTTRNQTNQ